MATDKLDFVFKKIDELAAAVAPEYNIINDRLAPAVKIPSISSDRSPDGRKNVVAMTDFLENQLKALHASVHRYPLGPEPDTDLQLPDIIIANYPSTYDANKKTILIYGHYDVQPAGDGWTTNPWTLTEKEGKLYGRGSTDDKGPLLAWLNALEAYQLANIDVPVNLIFCFEGMEESGSTGFATFASSPANSHIFAHVDAACISDNYWLTTRKPCLTYGLRGINYFKLTVEHPGVQLHSGMFGGCVYEPMTDLVILLSKLVDSQGRILIPGIEELVEGVTEEEVQEYATIEFTTRDFQDTIGSRANIFEDPKDTLMHRFRFPSLTIHGITGADSSPNQTTSIAPSVTAKFSIRTVPYMDQNSITNLTTHHLMHEFDKLRSKNTCRVELFGESAPYWLGTSDDANFRAGKMATQRVYKTEPDLTREGGSIGVTLDLQNVLGEKSIMLLPVGMSDDGAHGPNEKLDRVNYIEGSKLLGAYWYYFANPYS
ncbi:hypothetical protein SS1G_04565 [Sclerotinia sclerotiorum 1980 UF-70]|uniref:Peptidase M20 dimerisation domain-containing protein n=2 Tax=Sclerotinia sclerotiorum (strain ATCC 18683 / 1980 / Ss-1) TaxID=665079 RepID=A0A1D9PW27_SCLS1|nr:hypothetical protein SS1G_04565 [Sclerotinia sclerotiorum 1980 UF-70]APA06809.1 hypothetical protein sscle_02g015790 [Sclerotinia sclerotiorum 1980 UF-70]EDO02089.1 hypothetical protein SS1G_04565 [Sclerotinia sclerotiorum 1980 UF-70]